MIKKFLRLLYSSKLFAVVMLIFQLFILAVGYVWISDYNVYVLGATSLIGTMLVLYEVNRTDSPDFKTSWIVLISIIPVFGALLYIYLHADRSGKSIRAYQERAAELTKSPPDAEVIKEIRDPCTAGLCGYLSKYGGSRTYKNTRVEYFPLGDDFLEDMINELKKAERFIFLEYFIINQNKYIWPEILSVLRDKAAEGVEVRLLYDAMGCVGILPRGYDARLNKMGIKCRVFSPIQPLLSTYQNNRDHRKITVIDGRRAYCGGINLADEYANRIERFGHWKDVGVRLDGEGAAGFTGLFLNMWNGAGLCDSREDCLNYMSLAAPANADGFVTPYADSPLDDVQVGRQVYIDMLNTAQKYAHIMTPYLVIDEGIYEALKYAVQRGIDVKIIMPHIPDKKYMFWLARTYYPRLLGAGVRIFEYIPGFVHAKVTVSDDTKAAVGTVNYDFRSMYLHYECGAFINESACILDIENDFERTLDCCEEITMADYKRFNIFQKIFGRVLRILAPML